MWHRRAWADPAIRGGGVALATIALVLARHLARDGGPVEYLSALLTFLAGSAGAAMLLWGAHLFDEIHVPGRWRLDKEPATPRAAPPPRASAAAAGSRAAPPPS